MQIISLTNDYNILYDLSVYEYNILEFYKHIFIIDTFKESNYIIL